MHRPHSHYSSLIFLLIFACTTTANMTPINHQNDREYWAKFHQEWIGKDADRYKLYVFHNINEFNAAPEDLKLQGVEKWQAFYPQDPWPPDNPPKKHKAGPYISDKQIKEEAMIIIPAILQGSITNSMY